MMKKALVLVLILLFGISMLTGCAPKVSPLESALGSLTGELEDAFASMGTELEDAFASLGSELESTLDLATGSTGDSGDQIDPDKAPSVGGSGITTDALINETWDWMAPMSYAEESRLTYEQFADRLGSDGELRNTYDDKAVYRWHDPNGGVLLITFELTGDGSYCYDQMSRSGTNPDAGESGNADDLSLVGTWSISSAKDTDGTTYTADELMAFGMTGEIVLNEDKTASCDFSGEVYEGTWCLDDDYDDLLILTLLDEDGDEDDLYFDVVDDTLELDEDGAITVFSR